MGIRLTPIKAKIFDLVKKQPGVSLKEICWALYESVEESSIRTTKAHLSQIRDKFETTDILIIGVPHMGYKLEKRPRHGRLIPR